ncbi:prenylated flavin chaperone LpdD [Paenibacillus marinisediminis]
MNWSVPELSIRCRIERIGRDWLIVITGGEQEEHHHIGAVTIAYRDDLQAAVKTSTQVVPGHKEHYITEPMAVEAMQTLSGGNVTVVAGIHYDNLDKEQIETVVDAAWSCFRHELLHACNANSSI